MKNLLLIFTIFYAQILISQTLIINSGNTLDAEDPINIVFQLDSIIQNNTFPIEELNSDPISVRFERVETLVYKPNENNNGNPYRYETKEYDFEDKIITLSNVEGTFKYSFESEDNFLEYFDIPIGEKMTSIRIWVEFPNSNFFNNDFYDTNSEQYIGVVGPYGPQFEVFFKEGIDKTLYSNVFTISNNVVNSNLNSLIISATDDINIVVRDDCGSDNCERWLDNAKKNLAHPIFSDFTGDGVNDLVARVYSLYLGDIDWELTDEEKALYFSRWVLFKGESFGENEVQYSFYSSYDQINEAIILYSKDLDGDGDLDIYTVPDVYHGLESNKPDDWSGEVILYLNDGSGTFTRLDEDVVFPPKSIIGQLDTDSDIESIGSLANKYDSRYLWLGENSSVIQFFDKVNGSYTETRSPEIFIEPKDGNEIFYRKVVDLKLYDFNNDGNDDILFWLSQQEMLEIYFDDEGNFIGDTDTMSLEELGFISENYFIIIHGSDTGFDLSNTDFSNDILYTYSSNSYDEHYSFDIVELSEGKDVIFFMDIFSLGQYEVFFDDIYNGPMSTLYALDIDGENLTDITSSFFQDESNINYISSSNAPEFVDFNNDGLLDIYFWGGWATSSSSTKSLFLINKTTHFENAVVPFPDVNEFLLGDFNNDGYMNLFQSVENDLKLATNIKVLIENGRKTIDYEDTTPVILRLLLDTTIPVITLLGESTVTLEIGQVYTDAGATAEDNYDGDITEAIVTVNNVDTSVVGTYTVTYNVSDANGNVAVEVTRTVNVESSLSVDDNIKNILKIYPNPVDDKLIIQGLQKKTKVSIYTILGKLVLSEMVSTEIDVSNLKTGIYLIKVTDIEGQLVRRFMKK